METRVIGGKIAEARKRVSLSQTQLAEQLFISPQAVGKWERGESMPDIITFTRMAKILGVDLNYFTDSFPSLVAETALGEPTPAPSVLGVAGEGKEKVSWDMSRGNWADADFSGLANLHEKFSSSNMRKCLFIGSDLSELLLKNNNVESCDFSRSDLGGSNIQGSNMHNNSFRDCSLRETLFLRSNVMGCDFTGADLTGATFRTGGFQNNTLVRTNLNRTAFMSMWIVETLFEGRIENCSFENCSFKKVTFSNATLVNTFFKGKSMKRVQFIDCQADSLTYAFLKNGGANLSGVTLVQPT